MEDWIFISKPEFKFKASRSKNLLVTDNYLMPWKVTLKFVI